MNSQLRKPKKVETALRHLAFKKERLANAQHDLRVVKSDWLKRELFQKITTMEAGIDVYERLLKTLDKGA